jgi:hypothetical protein
MCTRSGGRQPPVARARECDFCDATYTHRSGGRQPPVVQTHCKCVAQLFGGHPTDALASASAVTVPPHSRRADARRSWLGESPPACAWRFLLHACSPNHGGLTPAALALGESRLLVRGDFPCTRVLGTTAGSRPPLLRRNANVCRRNCDFCDARTHMHQERGGVSPPWFTATHVQVRSRHGQRDCRPSTSDLRRICDPTRLGTGCSSQNSATCISGLRRSRGATSSTTSTAGSRPPLLCRNANVCRRSCHFCDGRTHMHQERGASAPVVHGNARARVSRHGQRDCRPCISGLRRSRGATSSTTFTAG